MQKYADHIRENGPEDTFAHINALATTLGFRLVGKEYVAIENPAAPRAVRRAVAKRPVAPAPVAVATSTRGRNLPKSFYTGLKALEVGQEVNITAALRAGRCDFDTFRNRLSAWQSRQPMHWRSFKVGTSIIVQRDR